MVSFGFFSQLFQQFVALLSVFCIVPSTPAPAVYSASTGPPAAVATDGEFAPPVRPRSPLPRVVQTQVDSAIAIGRAAARAADEVTFSVVRIPRLLVRSLERDGLLGLPGGGADAAAGVVDALEESAVLLVGVVGDAVLAELALLPGGAVRATPELAAAPQPIPGPVERQPLIVRVIQTQVDGAMDIGRALAGGALGLGSAMLAAPGIIASAVQSGGLAGIPAGLAAAGRQIVLAAQDGTVGVIRSVASLARAELALIPGATAGGPRRLAVVEPQAVRRVGPIELAVRVPLAVAVAVVDLAVAGAAAATRVTGAAVTAVTDVARAATDPKSEVTVAQAIARAPTTIANGLGDAGRELQVGVRRAATDFRETIRGRQQETAARSGVVTATGGSGTQIRTSSVASPGDTGTLRTADTGGGGNDEVQADGGTVNGAATPDPNTDPSAAGTPAAAGAE